MQERDFEQEIIAFEEKITARLLPHFVTLFERNPMGNDYLPYDNASQALFEESSTVCRLYGIESTELFQQIVPRAIERSTAYILGTISDYEGSHVGQPFENLDQRAKDAIKHLFLMIKEDIAAYKQSTLAIK